PVRVQAEIGETNVSVMQILIGGVWHETNTFSPIVTDLDSFKRGQFARGDQVIDRYRSTGTELGGMIAEAGRLQMNLAPTLFAAATPSGMIRQDAFEAIGDELCQRARERGDSVSGVLMALHGAMVAQNSDEADAALLTRLRDTVGAGVPIVATLDYHANISRALVDAADVLVVYDTFPHTDMAERGRDAARILHSLIEGAPRPACAFAKIPILPASDRQITTTQPMRDIMDGVRAARQEDGIVACSVAAGFAYADVAHLGMSVLTYGEEASARAITDRLTDAILDRRADFTSASLGVRDAVAQAGRSTPPIILADVADNVGGGAPGDGTAILGAILDQGLTGALVVLWDPAGAVEAAEIGVGGVFARQVGGHSGVDNGEPLHIEGTVKFAAPVTYRRTGSYMNGTTVELGMVGVVDAGGNTVVLTSERLMPFDSDHLEAVNIHVADHSIIVVKSGSAWRAAFAEIAKSVINVDAPGVTTQKFQQLNYRKRTGRMFPID
ncbi:MAG: M81 family metallopeptidase, partial [Alphaproteobacteria bacterium]